MAKITYKVIGAGSSKDNRVVVSAYCDDISVTICWIGRTTYDGECDDLYRDERLCTVVTITPVTPGKSIDPIDGTYIWKPDGTTEEVSVYYRVIRNCPPDIVPSCELFCDLVEAYSVPSKVPDNYKYDVDIHYKYFVTCEGWVCQDCGYSSKTEFTKCTKCGSENILDYVGSRKKNIGVKSVPLSKFNEGGNKCYTFKTAEGCETQICIGDREDPCSAGTDLYISVSLSKTVIPPNLSDEEGNPVFDDDWKILPSYECFDDQGNPVPITDNPEESQCHAVDGEMVEGVLKKYPRYDENNNPIPYYTVYVSIVYKLVETDENCNKITETGMLKYPWHIPPCKNGCVITGKAGGRVILESTSEGTKGRVSNKGGEIEFSIGTQKPTKETHPCCFDRTITGSTSIIDIKNELKSRGKIGNVGDIKSVYYNGVKTTSDNISYTVKMLAKKDGECAGVCRQTDKYGVVSGTTKVYYETQYMSNKWVSEDAPIRKWVCDDCGYSSETEFTECPECDSKNITVQESCGCNALSLYDEETGYVDSPYSVPFYGGRIKVEWDYVRHSVSDECDEYYTYGTWDEIIMIGGCDERPTDCNVCNGHGSSQGEPVEGCDCDALQIFDTECKVCDAECCYDDFGGKCSLLFKEQFPEFWDDMLMCNNGKSKLTIYKCKHCGALTPVMSDADDCEPPVPVDENGRQWCPSCERVEEGILEPIVFDMRHEYVETPTYECANCHAKLQSPGMSTNCEYELPTSCPFCHCGEEGKPPLELITGKEGEWYNKVRYEFKQDCNKICDYKRYVIYDHLTPDPIPCEGGSYSFEVSYTATTEFIGEGCPQNQTVVEKETIDVVVEQNPGAYDRTIIDDERITLIQQACEEDTSICGCYFLTIEEK